MFKKLLKHDIKDCCLDLLILSGVLLGLTLITALAISLYAVQLSILLVSGFGMIVVAMVVATFMAVIKNFHTKLFTNLGYLTLTTPVSIDKLLMSKIIASMLAVLLCLISVLLNILLLIAITTRAQLDISMLIFFGEVLSEPLVVVKGVLFLLAGILYGIMLLLFVLTLANTGRMKKNKWLMGILAYFIITFVTQATFELRIANSEWVNFALNIFFSLTFYLASRYVIINKLELE